MRLKLINNNQNTGFVVVDAKTGELLENVLEVKITEHWVHGKAETLIRLGRIQFGDEAAPGLPETNLYLPTPKDFP